MPASKTPVVAFLIAFVSWFSAGAEEPTPEGMQEMFNLSARRTKVLLELEYLDKRLAQLEKEQFAQFERVARTTGTDYWESISDNVTFARATQDIRAGELLLNHAPGIYRVKDVRPKLTTNGECWYFKPDRDIRKGEEFTIILVYDAPEELELKAKGFFPLTSRARDPDRPYNTEILIPGRPGNK